MAGRGFAALKAATIGMAVLIVAGVTVIVVTIVRRASAPAVVTGEVLLREPLGTRIVGASASGDRVVIQFSSGGSDRIAVLDARDGRVLLRVGLAP